MKHYQLKPIGSRARTADSSAPDAGWKPLSNKQKARLSILARAGAERHGVPLKKASLDDWRHQQAIQAVGCQVSEATQSQYNDLKSHFEDLAGDFESAYRTQIRAGDNKRRIALYKLNKALETAGLGTGYAATICWSTFKIELASASAKQLWSLYFTITKRGDNKS